MSARLLQRVPKPGNDRPVKLEKVPNELQRVRGEVPKRLGKPRLIVYLDPLSSSHGCRCGFAYWYDSKIMVLPGKCDEMIEILRESAANMPGCLSCVVAKDAADENTIWVTEV